MLDSISLTRGFLHAHFLCHSLETLRSSSNLVQSHSPCLFPLSQNYCPLWLNVQYPENRLSHKYFAFFLVIFGGRVILASVILSCSVHGFTSQIVLQVCSLKQHQKSISLPSSSLSSGSYLGLSGGSLFQILELFLCFVFTYLSIKTCILFRVEMLR